MLRLDKPDDYVVASNETQSVMELFQKAFGLLELDYKEYVKYDSQYERPAKVELLIGIPEKARRQLDWEPKVRFRDLVKIKS